MLAAAGTPWGGRGASAGQGGGVRGRRAPPVAASRSPPRQQRRPRAGARAPRRGVVRGGGNPPPGWRGLPPSTTRPPRCPPDRSCAASLPPSSSVAAAGAGKEGGGEDDRRRRGDAPVAAAAADAARPWPPRPLRRVLTMRPPPPRPARRRRPPSGRLPSAAATACRGCRDGYAAVVGDGRCRGGTRSAGDGGRATRPWPRHFAPMRTGCTTIGGGCGCGGSPVISDSLSCLLVLFATRRFSTQWHEGKTHPQPAVGSRGATTAGATVQPRGAPATDIRPGCRVTFRLRPPCRGERTRPPWPGAPACGSHPAHGDGRGARLARRAAGVAAPPPERRTLRVTPAARWRSDWLGLAVRHGHEKAPPPREPPPGGIGSARGQAGAPGDGRSSREGTIRGAGTYGFVGCAVPPEPCHRARALCPPAGSARCTGGLPMDVIE